MVNGLSAERPRSLYAVALIDVLGQSELLLRTTWPFRAEQDKLSAAESLVRAERNVDDLRQFFRTGYGGYRVVIDSDSGSDEQRRAALREAFRAQVKFLAFSDTVMAYVDLRDDPTLLQGLYAVMSTCADVFMVSLAAETPVRGAIDIGYAIKLSDNEIFGPVLASVHRLESKVARWPRMVFGDGAIHYLGKFREPVDGISPDSATRHVVGLCNGLRTRDVDGWEVLDYLGRTSVENHQRVSAEIADQACVPRRAFEFVRGEAEKRRDLRDGKLALRYNQTLQYFQSRAHLWPGMVDKRDEAAT